MSNERPADSPVPPPQPAALAAPTLGLEHPGEGLDLDYVPHSAKPLDIDGKPAVALSSSFGFGGHNAVLCLEAV